jgi:phosphoribosylformimino-5-aminoimidazole carboxamide ribotide isomerase
VREACRAFPDQVVVGIDARDGKVATEGWSETSSFGACELAKSFEGLGVTAIIYTDIGRDGMLSGINIDQTVALANAVSVPVIASGGVGSLQDLTELQNAAAGTSVRGVIIGRALYDGRIDPAQALAMFPYGSAH